MASVIRNQGTSSGQVVLGLADVRRKLLSLPQRMANNVVRRGLLAGAGVIREAARENAPVRKNKDGTPQAKSGDLKAAIAADTRGRFKDGEKKPTEHFAHVFIDKKQRKRKRSARAYAQYVEEGTLPHSMGKGDINTVWERSTATKKQDGPQHPGATASRFMKRAFDEKKEAAVQKLAEVTRQQLALELAKIAGTTRRAG